MGCLKGKKINADNAVGVVSGDSQIPARQQMNTIGVVSNPFVGI